MRDGDTIVALSSGSLPAGVAVIRFSGPESGVWLQRLTGGLPAERQLVLSDIRIDGELLDRGLVAWMPGPRSFTGEDCAELQLHGSSAVVRSLLRYASSVSGTRLAEAGEFTRRAFEHGKLDLTEVEGLGDLIDAETEGQRRQAIARFGGGLSKQLESWRSRVLDARAELEARLDFSDEGDVADSLPANYVQNLQSLGDELSNAIGQVTAGRIVREGLRVALAGPPNAGKSSLLNALSKSEVAIVTDEAGTTRDVREVAVNLGGQLVILIDMAGLRNADNKAEAEGVRRALEVIDTADLVLWLQPVDFPRLSPPDAAAPTWPLRTKIDLDRSVDGLSSVTGEGISELLERLKQYALSRTGEGVPVLVSRERDLQALVAGQQAVGDALRHLAIEEVAAEDLRRAASALERLLGRMDSEAVLDRLFSSFCIGK